MRLKTIGLISILVLGFLAGSLPADAQQTDKVYRVGYLSANRYVSCEAAKARLFFLSLQAGAGTDAWRLTHPGPDPLPVQLWAWFEIPGAPPAPTGC